MTERKEAIMSYCVNCGVELDASATKCPLCDTPVYNPKAPEPSTQPSPFPKEKGQVEVVKRKDLGVLLTVIVLATAVTCGLLNALVFRSSLWSLAVIGVFLVLWVIMIPVVIYTACLSVDSVRRCGGDRVSVSADLSDGTEWLVLWVGHSGGAACHSGGRSGDFLYP